MSDPASPVGELERACSRQGTPCDHGEVVWRHWPAQTATAEPPLILLHGGFGSWTHWLANIPGLRQRRQLWVPDLPGLGDSADLPEPHSADHFARILLVGLNQLLGPAADFDLAGFSFGAMIGARLAGQAGSRCRRFTAIGAAGFGDLHVQVHLQRPPAADVPWDEARSIHHANLRALMFSSDDYIDELALRIHADNLARHRFNSRRLSLTNDFAQALASIKAQLVGVWGSHDATAGGRAAIEQRRALFRQARANSEFHILDGVGHWAMYEAPQTVNRILCAG